MTAPSRPLPTVELRPPGPGDHDLISYLSSREVEGEFDFFDDSPDERLTWSMYGGGALMAQIPGGATVAQLTWIEIPYGPNRLSLARNIGIVLHPDFRGRGLAAAAQRALADYLFRTFPGNRVVASTDVRNVREQRSLTLAGFTNEGISRGAQWRGGEWCDLYLYSRLRTD